MNYLIVQGSSIRKQFVYCSSCGKKHVWLRAYKMAKRGTYKALCAECARFIKDTSVVLNAEAKA